MKCFECGCEYFRKSSLHLCPTCEAESKLDLPSEDEIQQEAARIRAANEAAHRGGTYDGEHHAQRRYEPVPTGTDHVSIYDCG